MELTTEQAKLLEAFAAIMSPKTADAAVLHNHIVAARGFAVKSIAEMTAVIDATAGGDTMPTVDPAANTPIPASLDPAPEPESKATAGWNKFKSVFKKVWPVAAVAAAFIPVPGVTLVTNAVTGILNTVGASTDPANLVGTAGGLAGVTALITAGVSEYRKQAAAEKPKE